ncbi:MAG: hypothetical protein KBT27_16105 [Prevotellaceae bacterium]|nr:hypothetical protein [Candidatus Faecinaster equi]
MKGDIHVKYDDILEGMRNIYSAKLVNMELEDKHDEVTYCLNFIKELNSRYCWRKHPLHGYMLSHTYTDKGQEVENLIFGIAHSHGFDIKIIECTYKMNKDGEKEELASPIKFYSVYRDDVPYDWKSM